MAGGALPEERGAAGRVARRWIGRGAREGVRSPRERTEHRCEHDRDENARMLLHRLVSLGPRGLPRRRHTLDPARLPRRPCQRRLAPGAVADPDGLDDLADEDHPVAAEAAAALVLDDRDERLQLGVRADDLELDDREIPVAIDDPGLEPLEGIGLVAIPERMDVDDGHTGRTRSPAPFHALIDLVT